uniref:Putative ovule protein n=1 Tax=Solanum chacoense TaxID=4108 RepID=A0A0V0GU05_SOLCH
MIIFNPSQLYFLNNLAHENCLQNRKMNYQIGYNPKTHIQIRKPDCATSYGGALQVLSLSLIC